MTHGVMCFVVCGGGKRWAKGLVSLKRALRVSARLWADTARPTAQRENREPGGRERGRRVEGMVCGLVELVQSRSMRCRAQEADVDHFWLEVLALERVSECMRQSRAPPRAVLPPLATVTSAGRESNVHDNQFVQSLTSSPSHKPSPIQLSLLPGIGPPRLIIIPIIRPPPAPAQQPVEHPDRPARIIIPLVLLLTILPPPESTRVGPVVSTIVAVLPAPGAPHPGRRMWLLVAHAVVERILVALRTGASLGRVGEGVAYAMYAGRARLSRGPTGSEKIIEARAWCRVVHRAAVVRR